MLPSVVRTWAPVGQTPILKTPTKYEHLSVASALTMTGKLVTSIQSSSFNGASIVRFLKHLLAEIAGKIVLFWDGAPIHRCEEVKQFLREGGAKRLHLIRIPAYSPDLNPDAGVWHWLKHRLGNMSSLTLPELGSELRQTIRALRYQRRILKSFFRLAGLAI